MIVTICKWRGTFFHVFVCWLLSISFVLSCGELEELFDKSKKKDPPSKDTEVVDTTPSKVRLLIIGDSLSFGFPGADSQAASSPSNFSYPIVTRDNLKKKGYDVSYHNIVSSLVEVGGLLLATISSPDKVSELLQDLFTSSWNEKLAAIGNTQQGVDMTIINVGIPGIETKHGKVVLPLAIQALKHKPTHILIALGANDGLADAASQFVPAENIKANIVHMIGVVKQNEAIPLLAGMKMYSPDAPGKAHYAQYTPQFNQVFPEISTEQNVSFWPFILQDVVNDEFTAWKPGMVVGDNLHPSYQGSQIIAGHFTEFVLTNVLQSVTPSNAPASE